MIKSKNINIPARLGEVEFVFSASEQYTECADFMSTWLSLVRNSQLTVLRNVETIIRVKLHGKVYGKLNYEDGEKIYTSTIVKIEKMPMPKPGVLGEFYLLACRWKRLPLSFRFVTETGSVYIVSMPSFARGTYRLMDATRRGMVSGMNFKRGFF